MLVGSKDRPEGEGPVLCGSVDERRAGEYMAEVRTSSQSERPCAGIEETRKAPADAGGSSSPVNGDDHTGKRLAGKPHEPFEPADGGRAKARPPPLGAANRRQLKRTPNGDDPQARQGMRVAKGFSQGSDALFSDNLARLSTSSFSRLWIFAPMRRGSPKGEDREEGSS